VSKVHNEKELSKIENELFQKLLEEESEEILNATCFICGNTFGCDKEGLDGSTYTINGISDLVLCCPCEDSFFYQTLRARLSESRAEEIASLLMTEEASDILELYEYGKEDEEDDETN
jgi:hypothetical protein